MITIDMSYYFRLLVILLVSLAGNIVTLSYIVVKRNPKLRELIINFMFEDEEEKNESHS